MTIDPRIYQALAIRAALKFYDKTKVKVNRNYTPKNMLRTASNITGKTYKLGEYFKAAEDLKTWVDERADHVG